MKPTTDNLRIAWFSPISFRAPLRSTIFTHQIFSHLPSNWCVQLFVDDESLLEIKAAGADDSTEASFAGIPVAHYLRASLYDEACPFDLFVFQLEDSPRCNFVMSSMEIWPGVCRFHDLNLHHLELSRVSYCTTGALLDEKLEDSDTGRTTTIGDWKARGWSTEVMESKFSFIEQQLNCASLVLVEDGWAVSGVESKTKRVPVSLVPYPVTIPSPRVVDSQRFLLRENLKIDKQQKVLGFCGRYRLEDRCYQILDAVRLYNESRPEPVLLLWSVATEVDEAFATAAVRKVFPNELNAAQQVMIVRSDSSSGYLSMLSAADIMLGLKYGPFRGVSLEVYEAMARGIPTVVSRFGAANDFPTGSVLKVDVGKAEVPTLVKILAEVLEDEELYSSLSAGAREYAAVVLSPEAVVYDISQLFEREAARFQEELKLRRSDYREAAERIFERQLQHVDRQMLGLGVPSESGASKELRRNLANLLFAAE